jgi:putative membrane protein
MNRSFSALIGVAVAAVLILCGVWYWQAHPYGMFYGMRRGFVGPGMMMGPGMGLAMMFFWVALIAVGVWAIAAIFRRSPGQASPSDALEILKQRYARGEIDKTEYEAKRRDLDR